jgi:hypothetical protein
MTTNGEPGPTSAVASRPKTANDRSGTDDAAPAPPDGTARAERDRLTRLLVTLGKLLGIVVTLVTLIGATVAVLFRLDPSVEPCIGGARATFSSVEVAPNYLLAQYFRDINPTLTPQGVSPLVGAEIRYSYSTSNLSGKNIRLYATLQRIAPDGDVSAPPGPPTGPTSSENLQRHVGLPNQALPVVTPNQCSQDSSGLDWIELPSSHHPRRFRVVLELYQGAEGIFNHRVGVGETPIFDY